MADGIADASLAYETIQPSRIKVGDSAIIRVTSLDGYLKSVPLPSVPGLTFENLGRSQGMEFVNGKILPSTFIVIRVTPQFAGLFSIPGLTAQSKPLLLEVVKGDEPNPYAFRDQKPKPLPVAPVPLPRNIQLQAGGAAFLQLVIPKRPVYVGESVPVDIDLGVRPGLVTSMNGLPSLTGGDFTLNNLSKQPKRRDQVIDGSPWAVMSWHSLLAAVKPGSFSLSAEAPLSAKINKPSSEDLAIASQMGWPFVQSLYNGIAPKDVTISSPSSELKVLPLPKDGRPKDFSGAVGEFQVSTEISPARVAVGDPLTLRLHVSGSGNFDRVDSSMFDHLEHWKTYPPKSSFKASDTIGYKGDKVFEQPLIASQPGEKTIPALDFNYFNPSTRQYERARTQPINVVVAASLSDSSLTAPGGSGLPADMANRSAGGLRPDHPHPQDTVSELRPLYFQATFLALPGTLALILAGSLLFVRPHAVRVTSKSAARALAELTSAARAGDVSAFLVLARTTLVQTLAARWHVSPEEITPAELHKRLGAGGEEIQKLFALADEARYSDFKPGSMDIQHWLGLIGRLIAGEGQ